MVFNIGGNHNRLDTVKLKVVGLTPLEKLRHGSAVSCPGVFISDVGGKEFNKAPAGVGAGIGDRAGQVLEPGSGELSAAIRGDFLGHRGILEGRLRIVCTTPQTGNQYQCNADRHNQEPGLEMPRAPPGESIVSI